jgi:hypothetical protein
MNLSQTSNWSDEIELSLQEVNNLFHVATSGAMSPLRSQLRKGLDQTQKATVKYYKRKASEAIDAVLNLIAPGQSSELKKMLLTESPPPPQEHMTSLIQLYNGTTDASLKTQILSLICREMTKTEILEKIPGITVYKTDQARQLSKQLDGFQVPVKRKHNRQKMNTEKLHHALDFFFDPAFMQIVSFGTRDISLDSGEKIIISDVVRTACHSQIIQLYENYCSETEFVPLSRSTLFHILKVCSASKRRNLQGLDNMAADGAEGYQALHSLTDRLHEMNILSAEDHKELSKKIKSSQIYMKTDYKLHIKDSDMCADHCITWSLSDPADANFQKGCDHTHPIQCDRCHLLLEIEEILQCTISKLSDHDAVLEKQKLLSDAMQQIFQWKSHIIRSVNQDKFRTTSLQNLQQHQAYIVLDWAMKFLPMKYREKQTDWFGQRGINWHVTVCVHRDVDGNLCVSI